MPRFDPPHYLTEHDGTRLREAQHALVNARGHYLGAAARRENCGPLSILSREMNKHAQVWDAVGSVFQIMGYAFTGSILLAPLGAQCAGVVAAIAWLRGGCTGEGFSRVLAKQAADGLSAVIDPAPGFGEAPLNMVGGGILMPILKPFRNILRDWGNGQTPKASDVANLAASSAKAGDIDDGGIAEGVAKKLGADNKAIAEAKRKSPPRKRSQASRPAGMLQASSAPSSGASSMLLSLAVGGALAAAVVIATRKT